MKDQIINEIQRKMLPYLNNEQLLHLKIVLETSFQGMIFEKGEELPKVERTERSKSIYHCKANRGMLGKNADILF